MPYRIALLVDDLHVSKSVRQLADWARDHPSIDLVALLVERPVDESAGVYAWFSRKAFALLTAVERNLVLRSSTDREHLRRHWIGDHARVERLGPALAQVRELDLDAIVHCGDAELAGDLLELPRDGVVSNIYGAASPGRTAMPGFWEVLEAHPATSFIVQRQTSRTSSDVLFRGSITTELFYSENRAALLDRATPYLLRTIDRLARGAAQVDPEQTSSDPQRGPARLHHAVSYVGRTIARAVQKGWRHAVGREWNWGVAYCFSPWEHAALEKGRLLPPLPSTFIADPFTLEVDGKHHIFVEEFPYATRKGVIAVYRVDDGQAERLGVALDEPYHLSFPFVFRKDGRTFMVPEGQKSGAIKLYECDDFPLRWSLKKVLMENVCAADTVLFEHGSLWWMLTTIKGEGRAANSAELHAFHADDPLGEWHPHERNPVVMDATKGRNGGLLKDSEGNIYRIAQRPGFRTYGDSFSIYRIDQLSEAAYAETLVKDVKPDFFPRLAGAHHMHSDGGLTVYDFSRDERP
jgi:hypothetical protein